MIGTLTRALGRERGTLPPALQHRIKRRLTIDPRTPIDEADYVAFDTELTGLDVKRDTIISIGAVKLRGGRIFPGRTFYRLIRPESELRPESVVVHELTHSDLEEAERASDALLEFLDFIGDSVLLGHFVHIDLSFVGRSMRKLFGANFARGAVDTATLHDWLVDNDSRFAAYHGGISLKKDLFSTAKRYGIAVDRAHDALYDAFLSAQLLQRFLPFLPAAGVRSVKELLEVSKP